MSVLDVRNLSVQYLTENGASEIVKDISFKVEKGEIAGLVGESGSGKSTAMLAVMGLLGDRAVIRSAQITVSGERPVPGKNAAMIFQDSLSCLNPSVKIGRQITETVRARRKCSRKEAEARAEDCWIWQGSAIPHSGCGSIRSNCPAGCVREWCLP